MSLVSVSENFLKAKGLKNPKPIIYGAIGAVAIIAAVVIIRRIRAKGGGKWTSDLTRSRLEDELNELNTYNTTITKSEAIIISQNLLNAMDMWGTDEQAIFDNLQRCKTAGDLNLVIQTFGVKPYDGLGLADTFLSRMIAGVMKNLNGWLRQELSGNYLKRVKEIYDELGVPF